MMSAKGNRRRARTLLAAAVMHALKWSRWGLGIALLGALCVAGCSGGGRGGGAGGNGGGGTPPAPPPANRAPVAANDVMRADGSALNSIAILANDADPDGD